MPPFPTKAIPADDGTAMYDQATADPCPQDDPENDVMPLPRALHGLTKGETVRVIHHQHTSSQTLRQEFAQRNVIDTGDIGSECPPRIGRTYTGNRHMQRNGGRI